MSAVFQPVQRRLTVEAYHDLARTGHLGEDDRVELIEGLLIEMAPIGHPHMTIVNRLNRLLVRAVGDDAVVSVQNPVTLPPFSEPQPDVVLLAPRFIDVSAGRPGARDVLLLIEVADSSLAYDRGIKCALYAREGIAEFWIVDVGAARIEVCRRPGSSGYGQHLAFGRGQTVTIEALAAVKVSVDDVFGDLPAG